MRHQFARLPGWAECAGTLTYVEHGGELVTRHPFDLTEASLFVFALRADRDRLEEMCERLFGGPSIGSEQLLPVGSHVLLIFVDVSDIRSSFAPDDRLGVVAEREVGVWVPVLDRRRNHAVWTLPYVFVNEPAPMAGGREIFGFPKQLGKVTLPGEGEGEGEDQAAFALRAPCIERFHPNACMEWRRVLQVKPVDAQEADSFTVRPDREPEPLKREPNGRLGDRQWKTPANGLLTMHAYGGRDRAVLPEVGSVRGGFAEVATMLARSELGGWTDEARAAALMLSHLAFGLVPVVLLKQFRDVADPRRACYQAIIEAEHEVLDFHSGGLIDGRWYVEADELDGEPLRRELGLRTAVADLALRLDLTFRIRRGRTLWEGRT